MTDRTRNIGQTSDSTVGKPSTSQPITVVEQFRRYDDTTGTTLAYEENADLWLAVHAVDPGAVHDIAESQLLVRHNIDGEGITVAKFGRHGAGDNAADARLLSEIIDSLSEIRDALSGFARRASEAS